MEKTLSIRFYTYHTELKLAGLSFKKIHNTDIESNIYRDDASGIYCINNQFHTNGKTARIEKEYLINGLAEIYECIPFSKIKTEGHYELTAEQLFDEITKRTEQL